MAEANLTAAERATTRADDAEAARDAAMEGLAAAEAARDEALAARVRRGTADREKPWNR